MPTIHQGRSVVLRHTLRDGSSHFDWLVEFQPGGALVATFRLATRPDGPGSFTAVPLNDHRRMYLDHEGPVSGDRGSVTRVAAGEVLRGVRDQEGAQFTVRWKGMTLDYEGRRGAGSWEFNAVSLDVG